MPIDHEVTREVWEGRIPVEFVLTEDVALVNQPKPYYLLVSRVSYFPLVLEKVKKYFLSFVDASEVEDLWLEYQGFPIKWHYPIGVLFDLLKRDEALPWEIGVRLKKFPVEEVVRLPSPEALESVFFQALKESDQLKHRAQVTSAMTQRDYKQLWNSLCGDRYDQFWTVNSRLMESNGEEPFFAVPLRFYKEDGGFVQRLWRPLDGEGQRLTLADVPEGVGVAWLAHGIRVPPATPLLWMAVNLAHPDGFVHLVPAQVV